MNNQPSPRFGEGIYTPIGSALMDLSGVHLGLGPSFGPISFPRAKTYFYGETDTFRVSNTGKLDFDDVHFVKELTFNLFSVSHMVPRENNVYNVDLKNIIPLGDLTCLFAKATLDEYNHWHKRLGHINFKTMNKLVKGIKREFSVARTPQQNVIAERKNRTLIEAARTMLADSLFPIPFWAEAVNTACYVQNRVLVTKPHNKTPYELLLGRTPSIGFMRPFGCLMTILNTLDPLGIFDRKADEGFLVGYSVSKNILKHIKQRREMFNNMCFFPYGLLVPNILKTLMMILPLKLKEPEFEVKEPESVVHVSPRSSAKTKKHDAKTTKEAKGKSHVELSTGFRNLSEEFEDVSDNSTNEVNPASTPVLAVGQISTNSTNTFSAAGPSNTVVSLTLRKSSYVDPSQYPDDLNMSALEDITYSNDDDDVGAEADFLNLETTITVSPIPTTRVHKDHHVSQIIGDLSLAPLIRSMTRMVKDQGRLNQINNEDFYTCMFVYFLSQEEPKRLHQALKDPSWIEAMQEELL
uniref:Retrovirus-related Pol polyprotein from transposon TNT 1-94 n=1 Tax=Tanacetum cinerariifolium TaxID=118510 RepID=A0A6L2JZD8_TANCI|nr:retrovirus-related Pol polyprotein from transposon TNT 1-94 [Tanacetum cinerariifolium]